VRIPGLLPSATYTALRVGWGGQPHDRQVWPEAVGRNRPEHFPAEGAAR
jgi:hypothetical protein